MVGWLGRASTILHYTHHVTHAGSRDTSVSFFLFLRFLYFVALSSSVTVGGVRAVLAGIMQIVTSAVRVFVHAHYIWPDPRELVGVAEYDQSTLGADTNRVALGVTPRVLPLHVQPYSSNGQPWRFSSPNKTSERQSLCGLCQDLGRWRIRTEVEQGSWSSSWVGLADFLRFLWR